LVESPIKVDTKIESKDRVYSKLYQKKTPPEIITIGSSTGGPEALKAFISKIPNTITKTILIVQHMPPLFTAQLAKALDSLTHYTVVEAKHNETIQEQTIYIAPGDYHMKVVEINGVKKIALNQAEKVCYVRPAADVLFDSIAHLYQGHILCFVLTGMGSDGCHGAKKIKDKGGTVIIQDEQSSVVWGMPGAIYEKAIEDDILNFEGMVEVLRNYY
jgi:two-component system chemotaxis response regulator CheB